MSTIYIIHEHIDWTKAITKWLDEAGVAYELWDLSKGRLNLAKEPPQGIFYNRMSASSHTRGHRYAPEYTQQVIKWLEHHGRKVINGSAAIDLEISKIKQYLALSDFGIKTPKTVAAFGREEIISAARDLYTYPLVIKHNRAGKGLGVHLFDNEEALIDYVTGDDFEPSVDGITLLQAYIKPHDGSIRRAEFIGKEYIYTLAIDSSDGFELCPADACQLDVAKQTAPCSIDGKFRIVEPLDKAIVDTYTHFLSETGIDVAAIEWAEDSNGNRYVYDINTNTNYNADAERKAGVSAPKQLADYLITELENLSS
ncbi:ATP-grasp domain-containing protein [Streptococcus sp. zg-JUN1979]|uniref:ATP-grasp domain-containing protein n=1 Tax=Streptococcus sp. zg-JUN1979 TaxID=3391450 RepID=UPI0039A6282B